MGRNAADLVSQILALDDDFQVFWSRETPPKAGRLRTVQQKLGVSLGGEHRALIEAFGACAVVARASAWPPPRPLEVRPLWQHARGVEIFGVAARCPPEIDLVRQIGARRPATRRKLVPAACRVGEGSVVGYDTRGILYEWRVGEAPTALAEASLIEVLADWLRTLAADKERIKAEPPPPPPQEHATPVPDLGALLAQAHSADADEREEAIGELGELSDPPADAVATVLAALRDKSEDVRCAAADALGLWARPEAVPALLSAIDAAFRRQRWWFGTELGHLQAAAAACGPGDARVVETLASQLVVAESKYAALAAFEALGQMGSGAAGAVTALGACAASSDSWLRAQAHAALASITGDLSTHVPPLLDALGDASGGGATKATAALALRRLGERARPFLTASHRKAAVREEVAKLLAQFDAPRRDRLPPSG